MNNWYEASIKSLIEEYFKAHGFNLTFDSSLYWDVAVENWLKNIPVESHKQFLEVAKDARSYAFNKKYGAYEYATDYRSVCPNWNSIILNEIVRLLGPLDGKKVIAVGANNGSELAIIFEKYFNTMSFDVVEISEDACKKGKELFPHMGFHCASMDEVELKEGAYDIFISLRAAYCAGNNLDFIAEKAYRSVKPGGVILFSISNGYIDVSNGAYTPIKGVYNPESNACNESETALNLGWMNESMLLHGCTQVNVVDAESEILLISKK